MKKLQLAILILVVIALFISADYFVNLPGGIPVSKPSLPSKTTTGQEGAEAAVNDYPNLVKEILTKNEFTQGYALEKRTRSKELFESFDLSEVANIGVYKNLLITDQGDKTPLYVYEIHGPTGQGSVTYLNIKLAMITQLGSESGINETGEYGYTSLFYNDPTRPETAFLLSQVGDVTFGFKYSKSSASAFDFIKALVNNYMSSISNNS